MEGGANEDDDHVNEATGESNGDTEDTEGMDTKAKALMHLLQTSSVSCRLCNYPHVGVS